MNPKKNSYKENNLNLTKQQTFNFDLKKIEDEEEKKVTRKIKNDKLKQKIQHIIDKKNEYKRKYILMFIFSIGLLFIVVGLLGVYSFLKDDYKKLNKKYTKLDKKYQQLEKVPKMDENVLFLGDSETEIYDLDDNYPNMHKINSGISGDTTEDILKDMDNRIYKYNPSKIILLIGTNDIENNFSNEKIIENIQKIVSEIKKNRPNSKIYLESVFPVKNNNTFKYRSNELIFDLNSKIKKLAKKEKLSYIDTYSVLLDNENQIDDKYTEDGLHLNEEGFKKITPEIKKYL